MTGQIFRHLLYSIRPSACLMASVLVLAAYRPTLASITEAAWLFVCAFFGSAYCFLLNDIFDREKDLLNKKSRPIATGELSLRGAWIGTGFCLLLYLLSAYFLGLLVLGLALFSIFLFSLYSSINQRSGTAANIIVAFCAAGTLWGVAILRDFELSLFYFSAVLFLLVFVREVMLDWLDMEGDKKSGKHSIPILYGSKKTLLIIGIILLLAFALIMWGMQMDFTLPARIILALSLPAIILPYIILAVSPSRESILFNIRFSHVAFVCLVLGVVLR